MKRKIRRVKNHQILKTITCTAALTALICFGVFCVWRYQDEQKQDEQTNNDTPTETISAAEYQNAESNNQEIKIVEKSKEDTNNKTESPEATTEAEEDSKSAAEAASKKQETAKNESGLKIAEPIVDAEPDGSDFYGEVPNILDEEGTCIFEFSNGTKTITKETGIVRTAKYVVCDHNELMLAPNELSVGEWTVQLKYKSKYAEGESEKEKFKIN